MDHQAVGRDKQHLEKHEEVECIAGQESPENTHQLKLKERVKTVAALIPTGANGIKQDDDCQHGRQQHHQRRQPVQHQHDTEWGGPVTQLIDLGRAGCGMRHKAECDHQNRACARQREHAL